jgi:hypothetical protein
VKGYLDVRSGRLEKVLIVNLRMLMYGNMVVCPRCNLENCRLCYRVSIVDATLTHGLRGRMMLSRKGEKVTTVNVNPRGLISCLRYYIPALHLTTPRLHQPGLTALSASVTRIPVAWVGVLVTEPLLAYLL